MKDLLPLQSCRTLNGNTISYYSNEMKHFTEKNKNIEVNKQTVLSVVNAMEKARDVRLQVLINCGINPKEKEWFSQKAWLNAFNKFAIDFGGMHLFLMGKAIIDNAQFPPIKSLEEGLKSIDIAYHMNHRVNGQIMFNALTKKMLEGIGHYELIEFNLKDRAATMVCNNPYPSRFDMGIITQIVRKFKPTGAREEVKLDTSKESRMTGGDSCTYIITW